MIDCFSLAVPLETPRKKSNPRHIEGKAHLCPQPGDVSKENPREFSPRSCVSERGDVFSRVSEMYGLSLYKCNLLGFSLTRLRMIKRNYEEKRCRWDLQKLFFFMVDYT